ncbi:unnamed protein product [Macrosiphum euphorbiae]|uniref:Uncharacterized protein n=1 Tax=Macrosiphum euphorbiae TaxID=13131 RepID=A0AAV0X1L9_9HEMI|nr:unnamed protein product [Macrosiphum euphorbiae]
MPIYAIWLFQMALPRVMWTFVDTFLWQNFANWLDRPNPTGVGPDQRKPSGKIKWGRANVGNAVMTFYGQLILEDCSSACYFVFLI